MSLKDIHLCALIVLSVFSVSAHCAPAGNSESQDQRQNWVTISAEELIATGVHELPIALAQLLPNLQAPVFSSTDGSDHVQTLLAQGLAPDQLILLVNGDRRHKSALLNFADVPGSGSLGPDLSMIPLAAIDRVEVTLGSSLGEYGGDALGAVINVILKKGDAPASFNAQYGLNSGELTGVRELSGVTTATDTVNLFFAGDRNVDDGDGETLWLTGGWGFDVGERGFVRLNADYRNQDPTNRSGFDPRQQYARTADGGFDLRETIVNRLNHSVGQGNTKQFNLLVNTELALTDNFDFYGTLTIGSLLTRTAGEFRRPLDTRNVIEIYPDGFLPEIKTNIDDRGFLFGVRGSAFGWEWDLGMNIGESEIDLSLDHSLNASLGPLSPTSFSTGNNEAREKRFGIEVTRSIDWRVPLEVRVGISQLEEDYEIERGDAASTLFGGAVTSTGELRELGTQGFPAFKIQKLDEGRDASIAFVAVSVTPNERSWLSAAFRYSDYSDVGVLFNVQLDGSFKINDRFGVRGSVAIGDRAPALAQNTYTKTATQFDTLGAPREAGILRPIDAAARLLGSDDMSEEEVSSVQLGLVAELLPGWQTSLDFYRIEVNDRVVLSDTLAGVGVEQLLSGAGIDEVASAAYFFNGVDYRSQGINLATTYRLDTTNFGSFAFSVAANISDIKVNPMDNPEVLSAIGLSRFGDLSVLQLEASAPDSKVIFTTHWQRSKFDMLVRAIRYGKVSDAAAGVVLGSQAVLNLALGYQATPKIKVNFGVNNGFDAYPVAFETGPGSAAATAIFPYSAYSPYGTDGRFVYLRMDASF